MTTKAKERAIAIKEDRDGDRNVILHPGNDDLFVRTGKQVIESCRLGISVELWLNELNSMLEEVRAWTAERQDKVRACYCAPRGTRTVLFFIPQSHQFDFDLADAMTALNMDLVNRFNVGMIEVRQIPANELDRFLTPASAKLVYGDSARPHPPVEA